MTFFAYVDELIVVIISMRALYRKYEYESDMDCFYLTKELL